MSGGQCCFLPVGSGGAEQGRERAHVRRGLVMLGTCTFELMLCRAAPWARQEPGLSPTSPDCLSFLSLVLRALPGLLVSQGHGQGQEEHRIPREPRNPGRTRHTVLAAVG